MQPYEYRRLAPVDQDKVVGDRRERGYPSHAPPHQECESELYLLTGTYFEHAHFMALAERRVEFEEKLLDFLSSVEGTQIFAWCVLPNHYHIVVRGEPEVLGKKLHRLYNGTSTGWNREDKTGGRKVWHRHFDRNLRTERLFHVSPNYVHTNAVKHGYARRAKDWPTCSAIQYLETLGRAEARKRGVIGAIIRF